MHNNRDSKKRILVPGSKLDGFFEQQFSSTLFSYRQIFSMLFPLILDQFFINTISLLTTAMISSSSQESVTAVSLVAPLSTLLYAVFGSISVGGTVVVAQYMGRGDKEKIRSASGQILLSSLLLAVVSCFFLVLFSNPLIRLAFGSADPIVIEKASHYLIGVAISQIFLSVYMGAFAVFRGMGASKVCLRLTIIINLIHLLASMLFLNVMKLDILGTALSLNLARFVGSIVAVFLLMNPNSMIRIHTRHIFQLDWGILRSIFRLGIPFSLEQIFFNGGSMLVQSYIVQLGTISIAANAITNSAFSVLYAAGLAVSTLASTVVGQCAGSGDKSMTRRYGIKMVWLATVISIISILLFMPLMPLILKLYHAPEETLSLIYQLLFIAILAMPFFWSMSNTMPNILRSAGDSVFCSTVSLTTMWVVRVGLGYLLAIPLRLGVQGVWISMGIEWAVRTFIFYLRYRSNIWLDKKVLE
jgi:putative MATE family efflux protein